MKHPADIVGGDIAAALDWIAELEKERDGLREELTQLRTDFCKAVSEREQANEQVNEQAGIIASLKGRLGE